MWGAIALIVGVTLIMTAIMLVLMRMVIKQQNQQKVSMQNIETAICRKENHV